MARADRGTGRRAGPPGEPASKRRNLAPELAIIRYHCRGESSLEESVLEIHNSNISIQRAEEVSRVLWGAELSPGLVGELSRLIAGRIESWRRRPIPGDHAYVFVDSIRVKLTGDGAMKFGDVLMAVGVNAHGFRTTLGTTAGSLEDENPLRDFLGDLKRRGLAGTRLFVAGWHPRLREELARLFPGASYQCSVTHACREVLALVPVEQLYFATECLRPVNRLSNSADDARLQLHEAIAALRKMKAREAATRLEEISGAMFHYYTQAPVHWRCLRSNESLRRIGREIRERARVLDSVADLRGAILMASARLRHIERTNWGRRRYLTME